MMEISESCLDTIGAMLCQEFAYHPPGIEETPTSDRFSSVGLDSRQRMLTFFYCLLEKIGSSRETAEIALSHLDRFLSLPRVGPPTLRNKKMFQLASTTCLYVAIKMHELQAITPTLVADLSHGVFTAQEVEEMEMVLAQTLQWRLNPPTALAFVRQYLDLFPDKILPREMKGAAYDLAMHQTELALEDPRLFCEKKSIVAYIAVQNAFDQLCAPVDLVDTVGVLLSDQALSYRYSDLRSVLQASLASMLPPSFTNSIPPPPLVTPQTKTSGWFSTSPTNSPPPESYYRVSPRSVNSSMV